VSSPSSRYRLQLIGPFKLLAPDGVRIPLASKKGIALVAMVATGRDGERTRKWLQDRLWGSRSPTQAQGSLRRELSNLRRVLGDVSPALLTFENDRIRIHFDAVLADFLGHAPDFKHELTELPPGEFLEGIDIPGEEGFEDWLREHRRFVAETRQRHMSAEKARISEGHPESQRTFPARSAMAVEPFESLSDQLNLDDLLKALGEELIHRFARLRWLPITSSARNAPSEATIAEDRARSALVKYWLRGRARRDGNRPVLFITLTDGEPGQILFTQQADLTELEAKDALAEFAITLVSVIGARIDNLEQLAARSRPDGELTPREVIFRGRWHFNRLTREDARKAHEYFERALEQDPDSTEALVHLAWAKERSIWAQRGGEHEVKDLRRLSQKIINLDGDDSRGYMLAGISELWLKSMSRAKALLAHSIALNPSLPMVHANLGSAYNLSGEPALAIAPLERALRLGPTDHETFFILGEIAMAYSLLQNWERAIEYAESSLGVTLYETVRLRRFWTFAAGNGETRKGLSLVFAANTRMSDGRRRAA
jgi:TolB-like protein